MIFSRESWRLAFQFLTRNSQLQTFNYSRMQLRPCKIDMPMNQSRWKVEKSMLEFKRYGDASDFLLDSEAFLLDREIERGLVHSISLRLKNEPMAFGVTPFLANGRSGDSVVLAAMQTPPHPLAICASSDLADSALEGLADMLLAESQPVTGVLAPDSLAQRFAVLWSTKNNIDYSLRRKECVFELRKVLPISIAEGYLRPAQSLDFELIARWFFDFMLETFRESMTDKEKTEVLESIGKRIEAGEFHLWIDEVAVSMAAATRPTSRGVSINAVYTPPQFRRKGYARSCVAHLSQKMFDQGKVFCILHTDLANPTSNKIYQEIGYKPVVTFSKYDFCTKLKSS